MYRHRVNRSGLTEKTDPTWLDAPSFPAVPSHVALGTLPSQTPDLEQLYCEPAHPRPTHEHACTVTHECASPDYCPRPQPNLPPPSIHEGPSKNSPSPTRPCQALQSWSCKDSSCADAEAVGGRWEVEKGGRRRRPLSSSSSGSLRLERTEDRLEG